MTVFNSSIVQSNTDTFNTVEADSGGGYFFPDPGEYPVYITGMEVDNNGTFNYRTDPKNKDETPTSIPCDNVSFRYVLMDDPGSGDGKPREFRGQLYQLCDKSLVPAHLEGQHKRISITLSKLKKAIEVVNGGSTGDFLTDLTTLKQNCDSGTVSVMLKCYQEQGKGNASNRTFERDAMLHRLEES